MRSPLRRVVSGCAIGLAFAAASCGTSEEAPPPPAAVSNPVDPATAGAITGVVTFEGQVPAREPINMDSDPYCTKQPANSTETVLVGAGAGLQNVFIYVKDGLGDRVFPVPSNSEARSEIVPIVTVAITIKGVVIRNDRRRVIGGSLRG